MNCGSFISLIIIPNVRDFMRARSDGHRSIWNGFESIRERCRTVNWDSWIVQIVGQCVRMNHDLFNDDGRQRCQQIGNCQFPPGNIFH